MKIYRIMKHDLFDGKNRIKKGEYVINNDSDHIQNNRRFVTTLNGKTSIETTIGAWDNNIKPCKLTLKKDEVFIMEFVTGGWHDFHAVGRNPYEMWKKCIKLFNYEERTNYNTHTIKNYRFFCDFCVSLSKVSIDSCYASEGRTDDNYHNKETVLIGDWLEIYYGEKER